MELPQGYELAYQYRWKRATYLIYDSLEEFRFYAKASGIR